MHKFLSDKILSALVLFAFLIANTPVARSGVWGDSWGNFVWGQGIIKEGLIMKEGLNLYAPTVELTDTVVDCFSLLTFLGGATAVESITSVDAAMQQTQKCAYQNGAPSADNFPIVLGTAYIVKMKLPRELTSGPPPACPETTLDAGVNLIGIGQPSTALTCFEVINSFGAGAVSAVQRFNIDRGVFETCTIDTTGSILGADFPILAGEGYIIHSTSTATPINLNDLTHLVCQ